MCATRSIIQQGEMMLYSTYAILAQHWVPWAVLIYVWGLLFTSNMIKKEVLFAVVETTLLVCSFASCSYISVHAHAYLSLSECIFFMYLCLCVCVFMCSCIENIFLLIPHVNASARRYHCVKKTVGPRMRSGPRSCCLHFGSRLWTH